ncbi:dCTP deaminase [bacterium]|nr:dCTP deaminase [bacterium]
MSVLSRRDIEKWLKKNKISERLIITPLLNPKESIGASSIDVRLGNKFILMKRQSLSVLDIGRDKNSKSVEKYQESICVNYKEGFHLHPHQLVIGSTFEYISIPSGLMCYVIGKSSWGRTGLIIATATKVDPGFRGCITLEIINEGEIPITLYPGLPIAQLVLHETSDRDMYNGKYKCPVGPEFPKFNKKNEDWRFWMPKEV